MGLRYRKSIRVGKSGTRINLSGSGVGISTGVKGARIGVGPRGTRTTLSIPGTGVSYTSQSGLGGRRGATKRSQQQAVMVALQPAPLQIVYQRPRPRIGKGILVLLLAGPLGLIIFGMGQTVWGALWRGWLFSIIMLVVLSHVP